MPIVHVSRPATVRMSRIERAAQLHDAAVSLLRANGVLRRYPGIPVTILTASVAGLSLALRPPISRSPQADEGLRYMPALVGRANIDLPHGLDVWAGPKVLSLEWDHDGRIEVRSFRRGPWEDLLLSEAANLHDRESPETAKM